MGLVSGVKDGDWVSVRQAIAKIGSIKLGPTASPTFAGLTLTGLTASRLTSTNASKGLASVSNLASWVAGTANEIDVADDGDGTITVGLVNPLIVGKGGTGVATLTDHGLLLGSGTDAITPLGVATNGQLPIGSTGADPVLAVLTAGTGIGVANAAGSITISSTITQYTDELAQDAVGGMVANTATINLTYTDLTPSLAADLNSTLKTNYDTAYTHSQIAGGDSVHVSTTENTNWDTAYTHSGLTAGNPHSVTPTELGLVIGTNVQAYDAGLTSLAGLTFASASFLKCTAENTYAVRTITETKQDLSLNAVENTALSTWAGTTNVTTLGTIATGVWNGTDVAIADGGTGQGTAQLAINALSAVAAATNEHVLTKDTATGNAIFKAAAGGSTVGGRRVSAYRSSSQSINATTWTVVVYNTELYDKLGEYNNSTGRFTASVAGYYHITASGTIKFAVAGKVALLDLYYNNTSEVAAVYFSAASVDAQGTTSKTVYLAQNDYIDVRAFHYDSVARNMNGTIMETYLTIDRVED